MPTTSSSRANVRRRSHSCSSPHSAISRESSGPASAQRSRAIHRPRSPKTARATGALKSSTPPSSRMAAPTRFLTLRRLLTLLGVILVCLLIWFAGPYLAFADVKPFASAVGRLVSILVIFVIWALVSQWRQWRAARATGELAAAAGTSTTPERTAEGGTMGGAD